MKIFKKLKIEIVYDQDKQAVANLVEKTNCNSFEVIGMLQNLINLELEKINKIKQKTWDVPKDEPDN